MKEFGTEYDNKADHGAPYVGPVILAEAEDLVQHHIRGPNGEQLRVLGEIVKRLQAEVHGDTKTWYKKL